MSFGIFVMLIIIILELIAVFYMFWIGLQHDAHNDIAKVESSAALQRMTEHGVDVVTASTHPPVAETEPTTSIPEPEPTVKMSGTDEAEESETESDSDES